ALERAPWTAQHHLLPKTTDKLLQFLALPPSQSALACNKGIRANRLDAMRSSLQWTRLRRALGFARAHRWLVVLILFMTILVSATNAVEPLVMKYVFDRLAEGGLVQALAAGVTGLIGLALLRELGSCFSNWISWRTRISLHYG